MTSDKPTRARGLNNNATALDSDVNRSRVIEALRNGLGVTSATAIVGITRDRLRIYRAKHPDFDDACANAVAEYEYGLLRVVNRGAEADPRLALEVLSRRFPARWSQRLEMRRDDESREADDRAAELAEMTDEELAAIARGDGSRSRTG